ncbi:xanthine dehydrogenase family protein molybdopterin-binding subunit [Pseudonocardia asaccharolytica]|uniref:Carbon-monoxide dehydrogenase large subunit n=1 Tax=Pseudonocardia asaccharolytica DSM 44247 = NBRC 16224 TaxID=1123024 RepID=A0A511D420_9PSEU|nr:molybdopterin cofactor-binding domain-containing protein [Pseudonocardia asaccharolytica]GEL17638.1 carbon-monoxide dehydrogenase large subunit [Pseudonocardia asaccharolytica DSM 44247 = NBRC 16224]
MTTTHDPAEQLAAPTRTEIGRARTRKEDARLITGRSRYTDAVVLPGLLHLAFVRSPFAHARITGIALDEARAMPGVVGVFTAADLGAEGITLPTAWPITPDMATPQRPPLAVDTVRFAGEGVAVVVARTPAEARDAADAVEVDYEPLEPVLDMEQALRDGAPLVHPDLGSNRNATWVFDSGAAGTGGSADEAIAAARDDPEQVVVKRRFRQQRVATAFMEPRSCVVDPTGEQLVLWAATQIPHILRIMLALTLGLPEHKLRVIAPDVGGGFGGKFGVLPEDVVAVLVARRLGVPVKWTETRSECMLTAHHGRDQIQDLTLAARRDGTVVALRVDLLADMGAYNALLGPGVPILGAFMFNAIYKFAAYRFACTNVYTTKTVTDAYRGAGRPEATFGIERMMDELAAELGMDPLELRRRNWINHDEFPFTTVAGLTYDSGNYEAATDEAVRLFDYDGLRAEQTRRRAEGDPVQLGIGISTFTEMCGIAPSRLLGQLAFGSGGWEHATVRMLPTGKVEVVTGTSPHGQGHVTAWSQIMADQLGVPFEDVEVLHGDTQVSAKGLDTYGSRSLAVGAIAAVHAADKVIEKARRIAAHMLEADASDVEFAQGRFTVRGTTKGVAIQEVAFATFTAHDLPDGIEPSLDADATFDPQNFSFPHGTHLAAAEVDTETGRVTLRSYVCVDDVGVVVNPVIVDGQMHGGLAQGIGQALHEEVVHDEAGTMTTGTFADYTIPAAPDLPAFTTGRTVTPATTNPLGVKGAGEAGTIAATPAVVNAVVDALRHLGVTDVAMPCTPQRVWRAIREAASSAAPPASTR